MQKKFLQTFMIVSIISAFWAERGQCNSLDTCYRCMTDKNKDPVCKLVWAKAGDICTKQAPTGLFDSQYSSCLAQTAHSLLYQVDSADCLNLCRLSCPTLPL